MSAGGPSIRRTDLVELLEGQILNGTLPTGSKLPSERKLAEHYSVSRSSVRESLRVLSERRLITVEQGRGAYVRESDPAAAAAAVTNALRREKVTARHVILGRRVLEAETAYAAATARTDEDLRAMELALADLTDSTAILEMIRADLDFHLALAHATHNPVLEAMFRAITGLTAELMLRSLADPAVTRKHLPQHQLILDAVRDGDAERARDQMREHLDVESAMKKYGPDFDTSLDAVAERQLSKVTEGARNLDDVMDMVQPLARRQP